MPSLTVYLLPFLIVAPFVARTQKFTLIFIKKTKKAISISENDGVKIYEEN